jgi:enamine deaminase RidA (YjgF/YER057c/UK114 family)
MKELTNSEFPIPIGAYSNGISIPIGDRTLVFVTGQVALNKDGEVMFPNDSAMQTEYIFKKIDSLLQEAGGSLDNIVKVVIYVTNMDDFPKISPIRNHFLGKSRPVSTLVEVSRLTIDNCVIEIEVTAII